MQGVEALLARLAPTTIEAAVQEGRVKGPKPLLGFGLHRAFWEEFRHRHGDLASEEAARFAIIFGPECAASYQQLADELSPRTETGAAVPAAPAQPGTDPYGNPVSLPWVRKD
jgi:hypothetical protein